MKRGSPRIVLDARPLSHPQAGGFRTYVRALTQGLKERAESGEATEKVVFYVDRPLTDESARFLPPGAPVRVVGTSRLRADGRIFREQLRRDAPDLVHGTTNYLPFLPNSVPATVTIHDAMGIKAYPWDIGVPRTPRERFINRYWAWRTRAAAHRSRRIVTVSQGAQEELMGVLGLDAAHFAVVHNGILLPVPCMNAPRETDSILVIESPDPRKNVTAAYQALFDNRACFGERPPRLCVVCNGERAAQRAQAAVEQGKRAGITVSLLTSPSDQALSDAYARSAVFAWPSRLEGFGLPPLEAMRNGCAVVSSSAPAMPEVLGDIPLYADPDRPYLFAEHLAHLLTHPEERAERGRLGQAHAARFTCRRMADETAAVWRKALTA